MTKIPEERQRRLDNRDRADREAATWATAMVFSEPLKMIGVVIAQDHVPGVAPVMTLVMAVQLFGYLSMAARVGGLGGYERIKWAEIFRWTAAGLYVVYMVGFAALFWDQYPIFWQRITAWW